MSVGFRKSLFGFNCDDVMNYIRKLHDSFSSKEIGLKGQIAELDEKIKDYDAEREKLLSEKAEIENKLAEYNEKAAEIERLSENIGKLYLVAQTNAKTIMNNAEENSRAVYSEISKNLDAIDETHSSLKELRESVINTSEAFKKEVDGVINSLIDAKSKILADAESDEKAKAEFLSVFESITK